MGNLVVLAVRWFKKGRESIGKKVAVISWLGFMATVVVQEVIYLYHLEHGDDSGYKFIISMLWCLFFVDICQVILNMLAKERLIEFFPGVYIGNLIYRFPPEPVQLSLCFPKER